MCLLLWHRMSSRLDGTPCLPNHRPLVFFFASLGSNNIPSLHHPLPCALCFQACMYTCRTPEFPVLRYWRWMWLGSSRPRSTMFSFAISVVSMPHRSRVPLAIGHTQTGRGTCGWALHPRNPSCSLEGLHARPIASLPRAPLWPLLAGLSYPLAQIQLHSPATQIWPQFLSALKCSPLQIHACQPKQLLHCLRVSPMMPPPWILRCRTTSIATLRARPLHLTYPLPSPAELPSLHNTLIHTNTHNCDDGRQLRLAFPMTSLQHRGNSTSLCLLDMFSHLLFT